MKRRCLVVSVAIAGLLGTAASAGAQAWSRDLFRPGSIEVDLGGSWQTRVPVGSSTAPLTGNQGPPIFDLFEVSTRIEAAPAVEARIGVHITRVFEIEGGFRFARPRLHTRITADFEDAEDVVAEETFSQYVFEVNGLVHLTGLRFGDGVPFVFGGGGYLRELHQGREIVETGQLFQGGAGIKLMFPRSARGLVRSLGLRADARVYARRRGIELDDEEPMRTYAAAGAALVIGF